MAEFKKHLFMRNPMCKPENYSSFYGWHRHTGIRIDQLDSLLCLPKGVYVNDSYGNTSRLATLLKNPPR